MRMKAYEWKDPGVLDTHHFCPWGDTGWTYFCVQTYTNGGTHSIGLGGPIGLDGEIEYSCRQSWPNEVERSLLLQVSTKRMFEFDQWRSIR